MTSAAHLASKLAAECVDYGCTEPALDDNCRCEKGRDAHRARNRRWKRGVALRRVQLEMAW